MAVTLEIQRDSIWYALEIDKETLELTYQINDISDISTRNGTFSKTIQVLGTGNNNKALGYAQNLNSVNYDFTKKVNARLKDDDLVFLQGYLNILSYKVDISTGLAVYECAIIANIANFFNNLGSKKLTDLNLTEFEHQKSYGNITQSWGEYRPYVYPLIDYGFNWGLERLNGYVNNTASVGTTGSLSQLVDGYFQNQLDMNELFPAVRVKYMFDKIISEAGYTYKSSFINDKIYTNTETDVDLKFKDLIMTCNNTYKSAIELNKFRVVGTYSTPIDIGLNQVKAPYFTYQDDPNNIFDFNSTTGYLNRYNSSAPSKFFINMVFDLEVFTDGTNNRENIVYIVPTRSKDPRTGFTYSPFDDSNYYEVEKLQVFKITYNQASLAGRANCSVDTFGQANVIAFTYSYTTPSYDTTYKLRVETRAETHYFNQWAGPYKIIDEANDEKMNIKIYNKGEGVSDLTLLRMEMYNEVCNEIKIPSAYLNQELNSFYDRPITKENEIPKDILQKDFFMSLCKMFNLYVEEDSKNKILTIEPRDTFYSNQTEVDITNNIVDESVSVKPLILEQPKEYLFTYKESDELLNSTYQKETKEIYGQALLSNNFELLKGRKEIEVLFEPGILSNIINSDIIITKVLDSFDSKIDIENKEYTPRILFFKMLDFPKPAFFTYNYNVIYFNNQPLAKYPYAGHLDDPYTPSFDLSFYNPIKRYYDSNVSFPNTAYNGATIDLDLNYPYKHNLIEAFYDKQLTIFNDPTSKLITIKCFITPNDLVKKFKFNNIFIIRLGDGVVKCLLNKITGYNISTYTCTLELIQI
jgi:hypothetical protein